MRVRKTRGVRWHSLFWNVNVAILNLDQLKAIIEEFKSKKEARKIQQLLSNDDLIAMMISTSLSGQYLQLKWKDLTKKQTKAELLNQLAELKSFCTELEETAEFEDFINLYKPCYADESSFQKIVELVNSISNRQNFKRQHFRNFEKMIDYIIQNIQPTSSETNLDKQIGKGFDFKLYSFLRNQGRFFSSHSKPFPDPTNTSVERSFGHLKWIEKKFESMGLSNLLETTAAKFNCLDDYIENCNIDIIIEAHRSQNEAEKTGRQIDLQNQKIKIEKIIGKNLNDNNQFDKLMIGAALCETNPGLIPEDLTMLKAKHKKYQKEARMTGTSVLGEKQFKMSLILCIRRLLKLGVPEVINEKDFEWSDSTSKAEMDKKLTKALFMYKAFEPKIRAVISFA